MRIARRRVEAECSETRSGEVWANGVMTPGEGMRVNNAFSIPGARPQWHSHESGQYLFVTVGRGSAYADGERPEIVDVGDSVWALAGEPEWHGATVDSRLQHHAVSPGGGPWMRPVGDDEYSAPQQSS